MQDVWQDHYQTLSIIFLKNMIKKSCRIKYKYCDYFLEYTNFKDDLIEYKSLCGSKSYQHKFDEKSKERFFNTNKFSKHNNNTLLLRKGACIYEYMADWQKFDETLLPEKKRLLQSLKYGRYCTRK